MKIYLPRATDFSGLVNSSILVLIEAYIIKGEKETKAF